MSGARRAFDALGANLRAGLALARGRRIDAAAFRADPTQVALAVAAFWIATLAAARLAGGTGAAFWIWGLIALAARFHLWLTVVAALAWLAGGRGASTLVIALLYAAAPVALVAGVAGELAGVLAPDAEPVYAQARLALAGLWLTLVFWRAFGLSLRPVLRVRLPATGAYAGALAAIAALVPAPPVFYAAPEPAPALDVEAVYYRQPALLEAAIEALEPQDPDAIDMYFLAVAPYASQDVFMHEALEARAIVERRLGLSGHTLALVNHRDTLDALPLANTPNLERALAALGATIDRDEDIVFVFLTSHGYEDASLAAELGRLAPNDIYAAALRRALDEAGILWRVVVISACYSGSFVDQLRSPTTLIVTAAAADRPSFGCAHENAWTYFGEAFFDRALARTTDLIAAGRLAQASIAARERREHKRASHPQLVAGARIAPHLEAWRAAARR